MALQLIDKNGNGKNILSGMILSRTKDNNILMLISDDDAAIYEILEKDGLTIAMGEYCEETIETKEHFIQTSVKNGGGARGLKDGQIIVEFII